MFGYVVMNKPEIKFKDFDMYRSFYCGLCRELKERYGLSGQITLTYDMTFVILLLSGLYEPPTKKGTTRCIVSTKYSLHLPPPMPEYNPRLLKVFLPDMHPLR